MTITSNEADRLMNFAAFIYLCNNDNFNVDEATDFAREMFREFCAIEDITDVDITDKVKDTDEEENECCGDCEECDDWNWCQDIDDDDSQDEVGFNPYIGGYDYDC